MILLNFTTSGTFDYRRQRFPHPDAHKRTRTSADEITCNVIRDISIYLFMNYVQFSDEMDTCCLQ
jgi:hypothetical protein